MAERNELTPDPVDDAALAVRFALGDDAPAADVVRLATRLHQPAEVKSDSQLANEKRFGELKARGAGEICPD